MSSLRYRPELSSRDRGRGLAATGALHVALLLLLFLGFSVARAPVDRATPPPPTVDLIDIPLPPPLPDDTEGGPPRAEDVVPRPVKSVPTAEVAPAPSQTEIVHTLSPIAPPAPTDLGAAAASSGNNSNGNGLGTGTGGRVDNSPNPSALPATRARRISGYIGGSDYPRSAIAMKSQGTTGALFTISPSGRIVGCDVISTSGNPDLDSTLCRLARERFVYRPARDSSGRPVTDSRKEYFAWVLPR